MNLKNFIILILAFALFMILPLTADEIHEAVRKGNLADVKKIILKNKDSLEAKTADGLTPLHLAVQTGNLPVVEFLLGQGAYIDSMDKQGNTPLLNAVNAKQTDIAKTLLSKGANVRLKNAQGMPAVVQAMMHGQDELTSLILDHGQNVNERFGQNATLLHLGVLLENKKIVELLLNKGADINAEAENSVTPLYAAVHIGNPELVDVFLARGADKSFREKPTGRTLLHLAALRGIGTIVESLIHGGCEINAEDKSGKTPYQYAAQYGHKKIADLLIREGARAKKTERDHGTPYLNQMPVKYGEALLWYMGTSGWAIKTKDKLLIFDYHDEGRKPDEPAMVNGHINPEQIKGLNTYVFISHEHGDHYQPSVFDWKNTINKITYILGFKPKNAPEAVYLNPREQKTIDGIKITTIASTDAGVGFLVEADGLSLFHAGDHACREKELNPAYTAEIDFLAAKNAGIDIAFLPITGCGFRDPDAVQRGIDYALEKLRPKTMFPMHVGGFEYQYAEFVQKAVQKTAQVKFDYAENRGDTFYYTEGKIIK